MSRGITPELESYLRNTSSIRMANLVKLELANSTEFLPVFTYLTDSHQRITYESQVYTPGKIRGINEIRQDTVPSNARLPIVFTGNDDSEIERALYATSDSNSYINKRVEIVRGFIDSSGSLIHSFLLFSGIISGVEISDPITTGESTIRWSVSNHFDSLNQVLGRFTDDASHRALVNGSPTASVKRPAYADDLGFMHANQAINVSAKYQATETRYSLKKKSGFLGFGGSVKLREYEVVVTKSVDLRFNLSAKYLPVVYGVRAVPAIPIFADTLRSDPSNVYIAYAVCEGEVEAFLDVIIDGNPLVCQNQADSQERTCIGNARSGDTVLGLGNTVGTVDRQHLIINDDQGRMEMWFYHGTSTQEASTPLRTIASAEDFLLQDGRTAEQYWGSNHRLLDTAYVVVKIELSGLDSGRTSIPEFEFVVEGRKIATYTDVNSNPVTSRTSINPAWQMYDYLSSRTFGPSIPIDQLDLASFIASAEYWDTIDTGYQASWVPFWRYLGWKSQRANTAEADPDEDWRHYLQMNTLLATENSVLDITRSLLQNSDAALNLLNGVYTLSAISHYPSSESFDVLDCIGSISTKDTNSQDKYNSINASINDPAALWDQTNITYFNSVYLDADRGLPKVGGFGFEYITNYYTARERARLFLDRSRYSRNVEVVLPPWGMKLFPTNIVEFSYPRYGWVNKQFRVLQTTINYNCSVKVRMVEHDPSIYIGVNQNDASGLQEPIISEVVPKPVDLQWNEYVGAEAGFNGTLSWEAPTTSDPILYFQVTYSGNAETIAVDTSFIVGNRYVLPLSGLEAGTYTFSVKTVLNNGRLSAPQILVASVDDPLIMQLVRGLSIVNTEDGFTNRFVGSDVILDWESAPEGYIASYDIQLLVPDSRALALSLSVNHLTDSDTQRVVINQSSLIAAYNNINNSLGIYREMIFRVRSRGTSGQVSIDWTEI